MNEHARGSRPLPPEGYRTSKYVASDIDARLIPEPLPVHDAQPVASAPSGAQAEGRASSSQTSTGFHSPMSKPDRMPGDERNGSSSPVPPKRDMELWLGRNAIGVVAAGLLFLGIAYFAVALIPQFADATKVAIMFSLSIAVTAVGSLLTVRKQNGFTTALMGCGAGSLFISVLATHLHFGMLDKAPAFALILAWMVMCLLLVRKTQSLLLDIVLQLGLAVSVCLGFSGGFEDGQPWLLVGYQLVASIIVIGGNLMFCPRMYRSSLLLALALSFITSLYIKEYCWPFTIFDAPTQERSLAFIVTVFALQFASATGYAAMVAHTILRDCATAVQEPATEGQGDTRTPRRLTSLLATDAALWLLVTFVDVLLPVTECLYHLGVLGATWSNAETAGIACQLVTVAAGYVALATAARKRQVRCDRNPVSSALSLLVCGGSVVALCGSIVACDHDASLPLGLLWVWAAFAVAIADKVGTPRHSVAALVCLVLESLLTSAFLFPGLVERFGMGFALAYGAVYTAVLCTLTGWILFRQDWRRVGTVLLAAMGTVLVMSYFAHCTPLDFRPWVWSICCMTCALIWVVLGFVMRHEQLRLCGLVVVLCCVVKLVIFDLAGLDSVAHTIAYVGGGLICFAVSALYNSATRHFGARQCG